MEAASLPLAASGFLSRPPPAAAAAAAACYSRRNLSCVRAALQALEAHEASKPPRLSPRRNAVTDVKAAPDPVTALTRFEDVLQTQDCNIILRHYGDTRSWDELSKSRRRQEEAWKMEAIARVTSDRKDRDQIETSLRSEENLLHLKADNDMQRYKSEMRVLEQQISQLKVSLDSSNVDAPKWGTDNKTYALRLSEGRKNSNAQILAKIAVPQYLDFDDIQRDRECVMCLSEEIAGKQFL